MLCWLHTHVSYPRGVMLCCWRCTQRSACCLTRSGGLLSVRGHGQVSRSYSQPRHDWERLEKENILTVPNLLSVARIALSPVTGYLVVEGNYSWAISLFAIVGVTDILDGYIARKFKGQSSNLGSVLDPLADKVFMSVVCVSMTYAGLLPVPLVVLVLGRDVLLIGASFYLRYTTLPPPRTWRRYWDIQRSTVQVTPNTLGKVTTGLQLMSVGAPLLSAMCQATTTPLLQTLWVLTGVATISSGVNYLFRMKGFKILNKPP
ncbi:probable cardiolipin synthase (CMP-forming) [Halichondria panicea]|uniref:probable cardiolipin synthase (CMP-forming) n=1 Tax=Halichondria panicea TaxID=6063 RepID=UPI00312B9127